MSYTLTLAHSFVLEDVKPAKLDLLVSQQVDCLLREATPRGVRVSFHEEHDGLLGDGQ